MNKYLPNGIRRIWNKYPWWLWILFLVGVFTILSVLGGLFLAVGSEPAGQYSSSPIPDVSDPAFITALANDLHSRTGNGGNIVPLINGNAFESALLQSIDQAKASINFSVYIWENGEFSQKIIAKLVEKQKQGVEVRVLLDSYGSSMLDDKAFDSLKAAGGKVEKFRSIKFGQITRYGHRDHRRAIIIDGRIGYTGGMAIADKWLGNAEDKNHWRDDMYQVSGPLAQSLQGDFTDIWSGINGEFLNGDKFYPALHAEDMGNQNLRYVHISQNPSPDVQILPDFITLSIAAAKKKLFIETPYFVPNGQLLNAIVNRAHAGVEVKLLLPDGHNDSKIDRLASQNFYQKLLDAGVSIYEYTPTFNHTKLMVIDGQWSIIGSPNLNTRSRRLDEENAFGVLDAKLGAEHEQIFSDDLKNAKQITTQDWHNRSIFRRPFEWLAQIFDKQI